MNDIKNIQTVAPFLADDFVDLDHEIFDVDKYNEFVQYKKTTLGLFSKYLVCKLHDSWVIETILTDNKFSIVLNDFSTYVMADAIIEKFALPINSDEISFPLTLSFDTNLIVTYHTVNDDGDLQLIPPTKLDEYLYEQVTIADTDKVEVVFHFWQSHPDKPGERIIVIVSAKNISVTEGQDLAWQRLFGNKYDDYYDYFKTQFNSERYVSDGHICSMLIDELDQARPANSA